MFVDVKTDDAMLGAMLVSPGFPRFLDNANRL